MPGTNEVHPENPIPCRTCTDFKTWAKFAKEKTSTNTKGNKTQIVCSS